MDKRLARPVPGDYVANLLPSAFQMCIVRRGLDLELKLDNSRSAEYKLAFHLRGVFARPNSYVISLA